jgi:hypothetical protein
MTLFNDGDPIIKVIDPNKDYYEELVGEDKPFKTNQDLAKAKAESDAFIENLKNENKALRQQAAEQITMKEFLTKLETAPKVKGDDNVNNQNTNGNQPNDENNNNNNNNARTISEEDIVRVLETREITKTKANNLNTVKEVLQKVWGSNYAATLQAKVSEMGVSQDFLDNMAATSPRAFLKLLDVEAAFNQKQEELSIFNPKPASSNSQAKGAASNTGSPQTFKEFKKLYPKDRDFYTGRVQNAMARTIKEVGEEKFYSS